MAATVFVTVPHNWTEWLRLAKIQLAEKGLNAEGKPETDIAIKIAAVLPSPIYSRVLTVHHLS